MIGVMKCASRSLTASCRFEHRASAIIGFAGQYASTCASAKASSSQDGVEQLRSRIVSLTAEIKGSKPTVAEQHAHIRLFQAAARAVPFQVTFANVDAIWPATTPRSWQRMG